MKIKNIVKNVIISLIIGLILGSITEFALILDIPWLIKITQSMTFWAICMLISSIISKGYIFSVLTPTLIMTAMNATYYIIRLVKSGYTNMASWEMFTLVGIAGSIYIGTIVYLIKEKIIHHKISNVIPKYNMLLMTICGICFYKFGTVYHVTNNLFDMIYSGIFIGFVIGTIIGYIRQTKNPQHTRL